MNVDPRCIKEMTSQQLARKWPNLNNSNHVLTSEHTLNYNCVSWATEDNTEWIDFYYDEENEDQSGERYAEYFKSKGFEFCNSFNFVSGFVKLAIFTDKYGNFTHVARSINENGWASKLGDLEDIEHVDLDCLSGDFYGKPTIFMQRHL